MEEIKKYILFGLVAALIIGVSTFMLVRRQKIKKNGKTATAVVTRIEEKESFDSDSGTLTLSGSGEALNSLFRICSRKQPLCASRAALLLRAGSTVRAGGLSTSGI